MYPFDWSSYSAYFSAETTQIFLKKRYAKQQIVNKEQMAYKNCYPFIYYIEHGKVYYDQAKKAPLIIKPILLFYGFIHLIKACILTLEPNYPENTSVLAHGVSSRKRKKQHYSFFKDEVKFQKTGLFPFLSEKMFHMKQLEGDRISMSELFNHLPELSELMNILEGHTTFLSIEKNREEIFIPVKILDSLCMTENRFTNFLEQKSAGAYAYHGLKNNKLFFTSQGNEACYHHPLHYNIIQNEFSIPLTKEYFNPFHEILTHYLLLYNLSMIARYETEWWSELVKTMPNKDYPLIQHFLKITTEKGPYLIHRYLTQTI